MAPVNRNAKSKATGSRRQSAPAQQRRHAAAKPPTRRQAAEDPEEEDETAFDATDDDDEEEDEDEEDDGELPATIDLSDVEAATFEVIPRGVYPGYIAGVEYTRSESKGLPMLVFECKFDYEDKERTLKYWAVLQGDGAGRTKAFLAKLDPELDLTGFDPYAMDEYFSGMEVMIRVTIRPDRDDRTIKRNNIGELLPAEEEEEG